MTFYTPIDKTSWHLWQSSKGKATFPWQTPQNSLLSIYDIEKCFVVFFFMTATTLGLPEALIADSLGKEPLNMKPSILIVDDVILIRHSLTEFLSRDYMVYQASNGREAIKMLGENKAIELVLRDVNMPEMDGMELLKNIHTDNNDMVVILMTAFPPLELLMYGGCEPCPSWHS